MVNCAEEADSPPEKLLAQSSQTMLTEPSTDSTRDSIAREVLGGFPSACRPQRLIGLRSAGGFSGARLWRLEAAGGSFCLRAMPADGVDLIRLRGLHRLLAHVRNSGVAQSPAPVPRSDGATFLLREGWVWQLEPWMSGIADYAIRRSTARLRNALCLLAQWHEAARTFVPQCDEAAWFASVAGASSPGIAERLHRIAKWDADSVARMRERLARRDWPDFDAEGLRLLELFEKGAPGIAARLQLGRLIAVPLQPCLRDVWHDHLLFTGDEATGLVDAHACRADNVATDLARLLGSLAEDDRGTWDAGLAAYEEIRPLSPHERGLVELFDQSAVLLGGLTWLEWKCVEGRRFERPGAVVARLRTLLGRLERLVQGERGA